MYLEGCGIVREIQAVLEGVWTSAHLRGQSRVPYAFLSAGKVFADHVNERRDGFVNKWPKGDAELVCQRLHQGDCGNVHVQ